MAASTRLTLKKREQFLLLLEENGGIVSDAAKDINISRHALYDLRDRDSKFKERWEAAVRIGSRKLEDDALRLAIEGEAEPVFYQGKVCGAVRKKPIALIIFMLKGRFPHKYRDRQEIMGKDGGPIQSESSNVHIYLPDNGRGDADSAPIKPAAAKRNGHRKRKRG